MKRGGHGSHDQCQRRKTVFDQGSWKDEHVEVLDIILYEFGDVFHRAQLKGG